MAATAECKLQCSSMRAIAFATSSALSDALGNKFNVEITKLTFTDNVPHNNGKHGKDYDHETHVF